MAPQRLNLIPKGWDDPVMHTDAAQYLLNLPGYILLAEGEGLGGHLLGVALPGGNADVLTLYVPLPARRQGVAKRLLGAFIETAQTQGALGVTLEVRTNNTAALALYKTCGFTQVALRQAYYPDGADALVLARQFG